MKGLPFEIIPVLPGSPEAGGSRHAEYLKKNPNGQVPMIEEDDGFVLYESHAIMTYLCDKHGWTDIYPSDPKTRALITQWLHWHHSNSRKFSAIKILPLYLGSKLSSEQQEKDEQELQKIATLIDKHLENKSFFVGGKVSLVDISLYSDLGQLDKHYLNFYDFTPYPNLHAWLQRMKTVAKYEEANKGIHEVKAFFDQIKGSH